MAPTEPQESAASVPQWFGWHLRLTQEIMILKEFLALRDLAPSLPQPPHSFCRMSDCGMAPGQVVWHSALVFIVGRCLGTAELVREGQQKEKEQTGPCGRGEQFPKYFTLYHLIDSLDNPLRGG